MKKPLNVFGPEWLERYSTEQANPTAKPVSTGLPSLDRISGDQGQRKGWGPWLCVLAGNPGIGKTTLALSMCSTALKQGVTVGMINLEQTNIQLSTRLYSIHAGRKVRELETGSFNEYEWEATSEELQQSPALYVPDGILLSWEEILEYAYAAYELGARWFCLDYLQLAASGTEQAIYEATQRVVTELRRFCLETESTVLMLSQWNRSGSLSEKPPVAANLAGGHVVEASADVVLGLDHTTVLRKYGTGYFKLLTLKNRHGAMVTGGIPIEVDYRTLRVTECSPDEDPWA
jgi:replicative DNA helicase